MPETVNEIIAETEIFATSAKGEKQQFHIAVGRPYCVDDVSWACSVSRVPVALDGMDRCEASLRKGSRALENLSAAPLPAAAPRLED